MAQSLFYACKHVIYEGKTTRRKVGDYEVNIEFFTQEDIDNRIPLGDTDEENVVLVAGDTITVPEGYTLTPNSPKKSMVIMCNKLVNNGTISMTAKAPNVLPHEWLIVNNLDGLDEVKIPAYANNRVNRVAFGSRYNHTVPNGNAGTNRNCGSGGSGGAYELTSVGATGSGYAFGGGAGSGGCCGNAVNTSSSPDVDTVYPMRGSNSHTLRSTTRGGVGNPSGNAQSSKGCGGRVIIFCADFENNGTISANGVQSQSTGGDAMNPQSSGGSSGGGAVDLFYTNMILEGTIIANGGAGGASNGGKSGAGGKGSVTPLKWDKEKVVKAQVKKFTHDNWVQLFGTYAGRIVEVL